MKLLTEWNDLIGKTIKKIDEETEYSEEAVIHFEDGSVAILDSVSDYESGYHYKFQLITDPDIEMLERIGFITHEEARARWMVEQLQEAKNQLASIKIRFPELFQIQTP